MTLIFFVMRVMSFIIGVLKYYQNADPWKDNQSRLDAIKITNSDLIRVNITEDLSFSCNQMIRTKISFRNMYLYNSIGMLNYDVKLDLLDNFGSG